MTRGRSDRDLAAVLEAWMDDVAPPAAPDHLLEAAFGRTVGTGQARAYPWDRVRRRKPGPRGLVLLGLGGVAALLVISLGAALLGGAGVGPGPTASPTPTPSPTASSSPSAPAPIPVTPEASVAIVAPQSLATDGTAVWVLTATGGVLRIDPATNTAGPVVQTGGLTDLYNGIAVDRNGVWVTDWDNQTLYRLNPTTGKVVTQIPAGSAPKGVLATGTAVWVADTHMGQVLRIDPATNKVAVPITVGPIGSSGPNWLGRGLGSIWTGIPNSSKVVRIDEKTNAVQATISIPVDTVPCGAFAVTADAVWIPSCDSATTMARIDPVTNTAVATVPLGGMAYTPALIGGAPWVSISTRVGTPASIARISAATNAVDRRLSPGADFGGGGDLVVAAGSVWAIDGGHDRVLRLPLSAFGPG